VVPSTLEPPLGFKGRPGMLAGSGVAIYALRANSTFPMNHLLIHPPLRRAPDPRSD
jgi:hypothetical protein